MANDMKTVGKLVGMKASADTSTTPMERKTAANGHLASAMSKLKAQAVKDGKR